MSSLKRHLVNPSEPLRTVDANKELLASLDRIVIYSPPVHTCSTGWVFQGFYSGPTSTAYLFYRLSRIFPSLEFKQQSLFDWAESYLELGSNVQNKAPDPNHCGIANETLAHLSLSAVMKQDENLARQVCSFEPAVNTKTEEGSNEWLYGRAGYLYCLRLCRTVFKDSASKTSSTASMLDNTIATTVARILSASQPWTWHEKSYFGAVHGAVGIITQLVLSQPSVAPAVQPLLSHLLDQQLESGNFPSSAGSESDRLVQFCHGGPGFNVSLRSLAPYFPGLKGRIEDAMRRADTDIWRRGVLTKTPCLSHGVAGNALALLGGDQRLKHFLSFMSTVSMEEVGWLDEIKKGDGFAGLYTGEAGRAWVWGVVAAGEDRVLLGYNDL
ncbi:hypothetical protein M426DRAFT_61267 [Hypoxylon sp. CI-4A]|nr:hypothetical protein M426DRAFT_61267 [Hypoxylon sp. CI-4A]